MEQQIFLSMELPEDPFNLVPETRKDIEKRARAANKEIERTAERNRLNRLAKNLKLDFKPLITLQKIKEAMENGPYKSFVTFSNRQMYEFKQDAESLYLVDMHGAKAAEWHLMPNGEIERVTLSGESKMIFKWEAESLKG